MKTFIVALMVGVLFGMAAAGAILWNIRQSVQENCRAAQAVHPHPGDNVAALVDFMNSGSHSLRDRNHKTIWTLGQLRDVLETIAFDPLPMEFAKQL